MIIDFNVSYMVLILFFKEVFCYFWYLYFVNIIIVEFWGFNEMK